MSVGQVDPCAVGQKDTKEGKTTKMVMGRLRKRLSYPLSVWCTQGQRPQLVSCEYHHHHCHYTEEVLHQDQDWQWVELVGIQNWSRQPNSLGKDSLLSKTCWTRLQTGKSCHHVLWVSRSILLVADWRKLLAVGSRQRRPISTQEKGHHGQAGEGLLKRLQRPSLPLQRRNRHESS